MFHIKIKKEQDAQDILKFIETHPNKNGIISMFLKKPPNNQGFMWCGNKGGQGYHWTDAEADGLKTISNMVLHKGWDSSGYGFMMRFLQYKIQRTNHF